jgi:hypothetical protein
MQTENDFPLTNGATVYSARALLKSLALGTSRVNSYDISTGKVDW